MLLLVSLEIGIINERIGTNVTVISSGRTFIHLGTLKQKKINKFFLQLIG
jgi:hypothetical protein